MADVDAERGKVPMGQLQSVQGFDVASLLRASVEAIWNRKMLGRILDLYAPQAIVHTGAGPAVRGNQQVLDHAVRWLAAFPDLRVFVDDLICVRRGAVSLASLRWTAVGHNGGPSALGAATGRRVVVSGIANARVEGGRYVEQWVELGDGDLVRQLGGKLVAALGRLWPEQAASDLDRLTGQGIAAMPADNAHPARPPEHSAVADPGALVRAAVDTIVNRRQIGEATRFFAAHYRERVADGRALFGCDELQAAIVSLLGTLPDLRLHVDDVFWDGEGLRDCRTSTRWTLLGTSSGPSAYGPPTNAFVRLSGISNHRIEEGQFVEGWTACSELSLARRLARTALGAQTEHGE